MATKEAHPAQAGLDHREKVKQQQNDEYYKREAAAKPTPTQEELDMAKVGIPVEPEPDGSDPEHVTVRRVMESRIPGANPYDTRSMDQRPASPAPAPAPKPAPKG
jgi:hypothetical protein